LTERVLAGVLWTSLAMGAQSVVQLLALVVLARLLSPSEFGVFGAVMVVIGFGTIFSQLGVGPAIVQRPVLEERHIRTGFTLSLLFSVAVIGVVWIGAPAIASFFHTPELEPVTRAACLVFACQGISTVAEAMAQRELRFRWLAGNDACALAAGFIGVGPVLAWSGFGVWALVGAYLTQYLVRAVILLAGQPHPKRPLLEVRAARELFYFGGGFTLARIGNYLAGHGDNLIVGRFLGVQALGLYTHAYQLMTAPATVVGLVLDRVLFPAMALVQLEPVRLARAYRSGVAVCALLILPASTILVILAPEIVLLLLGPAWMGVVEPFRILAVGMLFRSSYKLSDSVARATGAVYNRAWRQAAFALAIVGGSVIGQFWGLRGVALGVLAAIAINFFVMAQLSLRLTKMRWAEFGAAHVPALALAVALGMPASALVGWMRSMQLSPFVALFCTGLFVIAAGLLLCWCLPRAFLGRDAQALLRSLIDVAQVKRHRLGPAEEGAPS
jgi:O-antigen/teichoic acid export membrane protein